MLGFIHFNFDCLSIVWPLWPGTMHLWPCDLVPCTDDPLYHKLLCTNTCLFHASVFESKALWLSLPGTSTLSIKSVKPKMLSFNCYVPMSQFAQSHWGELQGVSRETKTRADAHVKMSMNRQTGEGRFFLNRVLSPGNAGIMLPRSWDQLVHPRWEG